MKCHWEWRRAKPPVTPSNGYIKPHVHKYGHGHVHRHTRHLGLKLVYVCAVGASIASGGLVAKGLSNYLPSSHETFTGGGGGGIGIGIGIGTGTGNGENERGRVPGSERGRNPGQAPVQTPEPSSLMLIIPSLGILFILRRRK